MLAKNMDTPLLNFDGKPIMVSATPESNPELFTFKTAILNCLGSKTPKDGKEAIEIYRLGCAIYDNKDDAHDIALLKAAVEENKPGYTAMIQGQLLLFLEN